MSVMIRNPTLEDALRLLYSDQSLTCLAKDSAVRHLIPINIFLGTPTGFFEWGNFCELKMRPPLPPLRSSDPRMLRSSPSFAYTASFAPRVAESGLWSSCVQANTLSHRVLARLLGLGYHERLLLPFMMCFHLGSPTVPLCNLLPIDCSFDPLQRFWRVSEHNGLLGSYSFTGNTPGPVPISRCEGSRREGAFFNSSGRKSLSLVEFDF